VQVSRLGFAANNSEGWEWGLCRVCRWRRVLSRLVPHSKVRMGIHGVSHGKPSPVCQWAGWAVCNHVCRLRCDGLNSVSCRLSAAMLHGAPVGGLVWRTSFALMNAASTLISPPTISFCSSLHIGSSGAGQSVRARGRWVDAALREGGAAHPLLVTSLNASMCNTRSGCVSKRRAMPYGVLKGRSRTALHTSGRHAEEHQTQGTARPSAPVANLSARVRSARAVGRAAAAVRCSA
jgi:hypothetical protein